MKRWVAHGDLALPLRIDDVLVRSWRILRLDHAFVVNESNNHAAIVRTKEVVDQFFVIALPRRGNISRQQALFFVDELHRFRSRINDIRAHLAGPMLGGDSIDDHRGRAAEISGLDAVFALKTVIDRRRNVVLEGAEYHDLTLFFSSLDELRRLRPCALRNCAEEQNNQHRKSKKSVARFSTVRHDSLPIAEMALKKIESPRNQQQSRGRGRRVNRAAAVPTYLPDLHLSEYRLRLFGYCPPSGHAKPRRGRHKRWTGLPDAGPEPRPSVSYPEAATCRRRPVPSFLPDCGSEIRRLGHAPVDPSIQATCPPLPPASLRDYPVKKRSHESNPA